MRAYDLQPLREPFDAAREDHHGWVFGLPPGIDSAQWPLDPSNAYPLMHAFTLEIPEDHRVQGPELVALSFFGVAPDHNDGGPVGEGVLPELLAAHRDAPPEDEERAALWRHARSSHPRLHRMKDILGCDYAAILLTREEYLGPRCFPPALAWPSVLAGVPAPNWLTGKRGPHPRRPAELATDRAVRRTVRERDPNAGVRAVEFPGPADAYESHFDEDYALKPWAEALLPNHIGGTMRPIQGYPAFGPSFIGFEETLGDFNFGGGNAQLDLETLQMDWACG